MSGRRKETTELDSPAVRERILAAVSAQLRDVFDQIPGSGLHLVATPIGNLGDMTLRALATIALCDRVYCEDTRVSGPMLTRFGIDRRLGTYHEHNAATVRPEILEAIAGGRSVALISDAGMPSISDPGFKLVRDVIAAGGEVYAVPGPSALVAAVAVSGLATDSFHFAGFLPNRGTARRTRLQALRDAETTLVCYESPHRLADSLADMADVLGERQAAVARELTKRFEEVKRGTLAELAAWARATPPRGEIAIVVGAQSEPPEVSDETIVEALRAAMQSMKPAAAAKHVAQALQVPRQRVYQLGLADKEAGSGRSDMGGGAGANS